ncbi:tRNA nucleotidyltransferase (CCA-adding enzyme) [Enteropsectra breve]|nr:tRNA nucleotidyltransferase (CCA-adding enzyme) [Enteropsectra breve]
MILFSKKEQKVLSAIKAVCESLDPPTTARLAGGFVRDKLMEIPSSDIDIALDNISGHDFAEKVVEFLGLEKEPHTILANPDKSKHLETCVLQVFGFSIDFVNLRSEKYTDSRIPEIQYGEPKEDAFRRDITINSIFYNLTTNKIEDFTKRGEKDIKNKLIDTPLDPEKTLDDDPLRVLRIFRFKAKFDFEIHPRVSQAIRQRRTIDAFMKKISYERIGAEIFKMLEYPKAHLGILEITKNSYENYIFRYPGPIAEGDWTHEAFCSTYRQLLTKIKNKKLCDIEVLGKLPLIVNAACLSDTVISPKLHSSFKEEAQILNLYIIMHRFIGVGIGISKKALCLNATVLKENLKAPKKLYEKIERIEKAFCFLSQNKGISTKEIVLETKDECFLALVLCIILDDARHFAAILEDISAANIWELWKEDPLIKGEYMLKKGYKGPEISKMLAMCFKTQIMYPDYSEEQIIEKVTRDSASK